VGIAQALILSAAVGVRFLSEEGVERINLKWDSLNELSAINGCVDDYTNIPMEAIQHEFAVGQNYEELVVTFATVIAGVVIVPLVTVVIYACKEFFPSMGRDSDDDFTKIDSN
jgi:hypothetical protein